jgi:hypothetical protein
VPPVSLWTTTRPVRPGAPGIQYLGHRWSTTAVNGVVQIFFVVLTTTNGVAGPVFATNVFTEAAVPQADCFRTSSVRAGVGCFVGRPGTENPSWTMGLQKIWRTSGICLTISSTRPTMQCLSRRHLNEFQVAQKHIGSRQPSLPMRVQRQTRDSLGRFDHLGDMRSRVRIAGALTRQCQHATGPRACAQTHSGALASE